VDQIEEQIVAIGIYIFSMIINSLRGSRNLIDVSHVVSARVEESLINLQSLPRCSIYY